MEKNLKYSNELQVVVGEHNLNIHSDVTQRNHQHINFIKCVAFATVVIAFDHVYVYIQIFKSPVW